MHVNKFEKNDARTPVMQSESGVIITLVASTFGARLLLSAASISALRLLVNIYAADIPTRKRFTELTLTPT